MIIRTYEPSSIFITLPPGISISQVIDKAQCCHLREAYACSVPSQRTLDVGTTQAGLKEQYTNATPTAHFPNGHGMNSTKSGNSHGQSSPTPTGNRPAYRPPYKPRRCRGSPNTPPEGDIEMQPAPTNNNKHPEPPEMHLQAGTGEHCEDVPMECVATALDPVDDDTHSSDKELQQHDNLALSGKVRESQVWILHTYGLLNLRNSQMQSWAECNARGPLSFFARDFEGPRLCSSGPIQLSDQLTHHKTA